MNLKRSGKTTGTLFSNIFKYYDIFYSIANADNILREESYEIKGT